MEEIIEVRQVTADEDDDIGELQVAEYLVMLLAFDVYVRYVEEATKAEAKDLHTGRGLRLLRIAESRQGEEIKNFLHENVTRDESKRSILRSFRVRTSDPQQASRRALTLRTALNRGGPVILKTVFKEARARKEVKVAITASMQEEAVQALAKIAVLSLQNSRIKLWVREAAKIAADGVVPETDGSTVQVVQETAPVPPVPQNPVELATETAANTVTELRMQRLKEEGTTYAAEAKDEQSAQQSTLKNVQLNATESARQALKDAGETDHPPTKSETIGIATAVALSIVSDASNPNSVPEALKRLDPEQRSAALTDGRVLVAAGAGGGKSTTLVCRVKYLVEERGVPPTKILVSSFNKKAAEELKTKIGKAVGGDLTNAMTVGTLHGLFLGAIKKYGTPEEKAMFEGKLNILTGSAIASAVNKIWRKCFATERADGSLKDADPPKAKQMRMAVTKWAGNGVSVAQAKATARGKTERDAAVWYEMYEGLKGAIPGWKPNCEGRAEARSEWDRFNKKNREHRGQNGQTYLRRIGDFDDMIAVFKNLLERNLDVRQKAQKAFDHVLIDECQDLNSQQHRVLELMTEHITDGKDGKSFWMIGDDKQCVSADTPISLSNGQTRLASNLKPGDRVLAYRNGELVEQALRVVAPSSWTEGFKITTEDGHVLTMSPNHKIWAQAPCLDDEEVAVYLMYRRDMGFRVGITNKCHAEDYLNSFGGRAFMEKAERMWILDVCSNREDALELEASYSLQYGVPTMVFGGINRGINQERIDRLFQKFGRNGARLLEERHLNFDLPHWMSQTYTKHGRTRRTIQMLAHTSKGTQVALEWSGDDLDGSLEGISFQRKGERRRLRKWFHNYRAALSFAEDLQRRTDANLSRRLATQDGAIRLATASGLHAGMRVLVQTEDGVELDTIHSVEKVPGVFLDLDVDDASNFFGGGILSHNSIYHFRGARPDLFTGLDGKEGWTTRMIRTNYRCPPEVVDAANKLVAHNEGQIPMEANPAPSRARGEASITVRGYGDEAETAIAVAGEIKATWDSGLGAISDNAILCRTNNELNSYETALLMRGVPYARKGASSFLSSPETKAVLGYISLVSDTDFEKMQEALVDILNKPNRFFVAPDKVERAVSIALSNYARSEGIAKKAINPMVALRNKDFQDDLIESLTGGSVKDFKGRKALGTLGDLLDALNQLELLTKDPEASTKDMFDSVLDMPGVAFEIDQDSGRIIGQKTVTFREELNATLKDFGSEEDDVKEDEAEAQSLGNVAFLYELAKPDSNDPGDLEVSPEKPHGFWAKMGRLTEKAKELRIDLDKWEKEQDKLPPEDRKPAPGVYLGTVHSVKGAQWPNVFVQMNRGRFPIEPRGDGDDDGLPLTAEQQAEQEEEARGERRLAYVALTRPSKNLRVVYSGQYQGKAAGPSSFIAEAGLVNGENVGLETLPKTSAFIEDLVN